MEILRTAIEEEWHKTYPLPEGVKWKHTTPFAGQNLGNKERHIQTLNDKKIQ